MTSLLVKEIQGFHAKLRNMASISACPTITFCIWWITILNFPNLPNENLKYSLEQDFTLTCPAMLQILIKCLCKWPTCPMRPKQKPSKGISLLDSARVGIYIFYYSENFIEQGVHTISRSSAKDSILTLSVHI